MMNQASYFSDWLNSWAQWGWFGITIVFVILTSMVIIGFLMILMRAYGDTPLKLIVSGVLLIFLFNFIFSGLFGFNYTAFLQWYWGEFFHL
ncbi:MAG: hypothetical protein EAX96_14860 [Candidatus Lokiarchaeota archaeon]|nr:hypothetical protein [Candidatus Lokiarchaeota archaeon]